VYHKAKTPCIAFSVDKKSINLSIHCDRGLTFYTDRSVLRATAIFLAKKGCNRKIQQLFLGFIHSQKQLPIRKHLPLLLFACMISLTFTSCKKSSSSMGSESV